MRAAEADLIEAQNATQDRERRLAVALGRYNEALGQITDLLNMVANN